MFTRNYLLSVVVVTGVLAVAGAMSMTAAPQKTAADPKAQNTLAIGEPEVKQLLLLMDTDKNGKISKKEYMTFMEAEFDRLDEDKSGELDPKGADAVVLPSESSGAGQEVSRPGSALDGMPLKRAACAKLARMPANFKADLVACFGQPVAENPTGAMQEAAFRALGLNWRYLTVEVAPENLRDAILGMRAFGLKGANFTIPHKVAVLEYLDEVAPDAAIVGAVNTVRREGHRLIGENTDGKGFLRGVRTDAGIDPRGKRVVVLGAGGAARAVVTELALAGAADVLVVNRSAPRGEGMVAGLLSKIGARIRFEPWPGVYAVPADADILVNATSIGLYPGIDAMPPVDLRAARPDMLVCDVVFNPPETRLIRAARDRGLPVLDGLAMLVYQGTIGFELWTGHQAPEAVMKEALRTALGQ